MRTSGVGQSEWKQVYFVVKYGLYISIRKTSLFTRSVEKPDLCMSPPFKIPTELPCLFVRVRVFQKRDHCNVGPENAIYTNFNISISV